MSAEHDFHSTLDRAAGLTLDATCALRAAGAGRLPQPHRRQLQTAIRSLERTQDTLFNLRTDPWQLPKPKHRQLALL